MRVHEGTRREQQPGRYDDGFKSTAREWCASLVSLTFMRAFRPRFLIARSMPARQTPEALIYKAFWDPPTGRDPGFRNSGKVPSEVPDEPRVFPESLC